MVLGGGVQLHPGGVGSSTAVHHRLLPASPRGFQHPLPLFPDHCCPHTQHLAHRTHLVSRRTQADMQDSYKVLNVCSSLTSFNQLCLPTYDSYEELHKMLKLAISEGSEGFGMLWLLHHWRCGSTGTRGKPAMLFPVPFSPAIICI